MEPEPFKTKILKFNDITLTMVCLPEHGWGMPARMVGRALGYTDDGQKLGDHLNKPRWGLVVGLDRLTLTGEPLAQLKAIAGFQSNASSVVFLSVQGIRKVLLRSGTKLASKFRKYLAEHGGEAFEGVSLAVKTHAPPIRGSVGDAPPIRGSVEQRSVSEFTKLLTWMRKEGLATTDELKTFGFRAAERFLAKFGSVPPASASASTPLALPSGLKFTVTGVPLEGDHPDCPGWLTAAEIAQPYGKDGNHFSRIISEYCASLGMKLPNVQAKAASRASGTLPVDERGYCALHVPKLNGYARWGTSPNGMSLWINVWGPEAQKAIKKRYEDKALESGTPLFTQTSFPNLERKTSKS